MDAVGNGCSRFASSLFPWMSAITRRSRLKLSGLNAGLETSEDIGSKTRHQSGDDMRRGSRVPSRNGLKMPQRSRLIYSLSSFGDKNPKIITTVLRLLYML